MIRAAVAKIWGPPVAREVGYRLPDCSKCRRQGFEDARVAWGCDKPADEAVFSTTCGECKGSGCDACEHTGATEHFRCPSAVVMQNPKTFMGVRELLDAYRQHDAHGILPAPGALLDQSAAYIAAISVIDEERGRWDRLLDDHHRQQRERSKQKPKKAGM